MGASWTAAGFVHGVINSDNVTITGESFDYGPYRFLAEYDPKFVAAYFDPFGLYAYGRQPEALLWNLSRLGECLMPFCSPAKLEAVLDGFSPAFGRSLAKATLDRLGLERGDLARTSPSLAWFTTSWTRAGFRSSNSSSTGAAVRPAWSGRRRARPRSSTVSRLSTPCAPVCWSASPPDSANLDHPYFAGKPCTLLIDEIEALWAPITAEDDWSGWHAKLNEIAVAAEAYGVTTAEALESSQPGPSP